MEHYKRKLLKREREAQTGKEEWGKTYDDIARELSGFRAEIEALQTENKSLREQRQRQAAAASNSVPAHDDESG